MRIYVSTDTDHKTYRPFNGTPKQCIVQWVGSGYCGCRCVMILKEQLFDNMVDAHYKKRWTDYYEFHMERFWSDHTKKYGDSHIELK